MLEIFHNSIHGMVEQNYPNKLGKRLKRLGIYQMLFEGMNVDQAANWSRGKPWREISNVKKEVLMVRNTGTGKSWRI